MGSYRAARKPEICDVERLLVFANELAVPRVRGGFFVAQIGSQGHSLMLQQKKMMHPRVHP